MDKLLSNIEMLNETLAVFARGGYEKNGRVVRLKTSFREQRECKVLLPEDVESICEHKFVSKPYSTGKISVDCVNTDSFSAAISVHDRYLTDKQGERILVLNFANPVNPGGGVRNGAIAQEEDLCRKSSLLLSLESENARRYYEYNRSLNSRMASDAMIFSKKTEIIRDKNGELLDDTVTVGVLTCAAPYVVHGIGDMTPEDYMEVLSHRISAMLKCAAFMGYSHLVLGAWGCGAFGNDPNLVAELFYRAVKEFDYDGVGFKGFFRSVTFAVLSRDREQKNFKAFEEFFTDYNFYRDEYQPVYDAVEQTIKQKERYLSKVKGCLVGGAAGDALGYAVEFMSESAIFGTYGESGITEYRLDGSGRALISDDTQMTLFTACGLLFGETRGKLRGIGVNPAHCVAAAYNDWLLTQRISFEQRGNQKHYTWLWNVPELFSPRAPGNTCLSALSNRANVFDGRARNNSKGCGGVMRVAPIALLCDKAYIRAIAKEAASIAAITHGHPLGCIPAAAVAYVIHRCVYDERGLSLLQIAEEARDAVADMYKDEPCAADFTKLFNKAIRLSQNGKADLDNIHALGEGWVADEAFAIALYCALRYHDDFDKCIIAAVNHKGDSDSTGAIAGNILGAWLGYDAIGEKWKKNLELIDVTEDIAADLCHGCMMSQYSPYRDETWIEKYITFTYSPRR